jgi:hypothetical protein
MGVFTWGAVYGERQAQQVVLDAGLLARIEALEVRATEAAKVRSISITTERLDVAVYPVENLGKVAAK